MATRKKLIGLLAVAVLAAEPSIAGAQDGAAVVLEIRGRGGTALRRAVVQALDEIELVSLADARDAAGGEPLSTRDGRAAAARELGLELLIGGRVARRGARPAAVLEAYGPDGAGVASRDLRRTAGQAGRREVRAAARELVEQAFAAIDRNREEAEAEARGAAERRRALDAVRDEERLEAEDEDEAEDAEAAGPRLAALGGVGLRGRQLRIAHDDGATAVHETGVHPELSVGLRSRPFRGAISGLGFEALFAAGLGMSAADAAGNRISASAIRFRAGARYEHSLGPVGLGGSISFGLDSTSLDENAIVPSARYVHLRFGAGGSVALAGEVLRASAELGIRPVLSTGGLDDVQTVRAFGFDFTVGVGGALDVGFTYGAELSVARYGLRFGGLPAGASASAAIDGKDRAIGLLLLAGWEIL